MTLLVPHSIILAPPYSTLPYSILLGPPFVLIGHSRGGKVSVLASALDRGYGIVRKVGSVSIAGAGQRVAGAGQRIGGLVLIDPVDSTYEPVEEEG